MKSSLEVVNYLNNMVNDSRIDFRYMNDILSLAVGGENIVLQLDDTLRDILGFNQNKFESGKDVRAKDKISLTRRINYFAIYSNITANVRVGNVEAPLLAMVHSILKIVAFYLNADLKSFTMLIFRQTTLHKLTSPFMMTLALSFLFTRMLSHQLPFIFDESLNAK